MACYKWIFYAVLLLCCCSYHKTSAQDAGWLKGWWEYYSISPNIMKGEPVESRLHITELTDNSYTGIQKIYSSHDTNVFVTRECSGTFINTDISFAPGKELYRKEPNDAYIWNAYTKYMVANSYFSISHNKLILHIKVKSEQADFVTEFAYYRDLVLLPFSLRMQLEKRYGSPRLTGDADTIKVVTPLEPDRDDTTTYVSFAHGQDSVPPEIAARKNTLVKTLAVTSPDIQIILLDDAEIDGDIISLYHNNQLVLDHKTIGKEMVKYVLKADAEHAYHEFILVAENLGSIPPNTALVRIRAGETKYEFVVHSDMQENVKFIINYTGDNKIDITSPHK